MLHTPLSPLTKEHHQEYQVHNTEFKMPSRKEKESLLKRYAKKLGLNDRGCYLAVGLAVIAFLLLLVIIIMAVCWPGGKIFQLLRKYFNTTDDLPGQLILFLAFTSPESYPLFRE